MTLTTDTAVAEQLRGVFADAGVDGFLHARDIDSDAEVGFQPDVPVVTASTFKLPVLVELFRQADAGVLDLAAAVTVPVTDRAPGPTGLSVMLDPVTMSWRDLALSMIVVSDNAATDVVCERVGLRAVNDAMAQFGLEGTYLETDCRGIFASMAADSGVGSLADFPMPPPPELVGRLTALQPEHTDRTLPRDLTRLLQLVWRDEAATPESCAHIRRILGHQVWPHRLASGFPEDDVSTAGKTGTLVTWRNEVGVVQYGDGARYAVSVFTRSHTVRLKHPAADAAIGTAARLAVDALRSRR